MAPSLDDDDDANEANEAPPKTGTNANATRSIAPAPVALEAPPRLETNASAPPSTVDDNDDEFADAAAKEVLADAAIDERRREKANATTKSETKLAKLSLIHI